MNVTDRAIMAIQDLAIRQGCSYPLVRIKVTYPQPGQRMISTNFVQDHHINSQSDVLSEHWGGDICIVMDQLSDSELALATLDVSGGHRFIFKWPQETNNELHAEGKRQNNRNRKRRKNRRTRRAGPGPGRGLCGLPV